MKEEGWRVKVNLMQYYLTNKYEDILCENNEEERNVKITRDRMIGGKSTCPTLIRQLRKTNKNIEKKSYVPIKDTKTAEDQRLKKMIEEAKYK